MQIKVMGGFLDGIDGDRFYRHLQTRQTIIDRIDFDRRDGHNEQKMAEED